MKPADHLRNCAIFSGLCQGALEELASLAEERSCQDGCTVFLEGEEAGALHILIDGSIDLVKGWQDGRSRVVRSVGRGEMFAEAAMFSGEAYPATAVARKRSSVLLIRKEHFVAFVRRHPDVSLAMMGAMSRLLRHMNALLADLSLGQVENRLAAFLVAKSRERGKKRFSIGITKQELALRIGTVPETLSRNLKKLKDRGIVAVDGDLVTIHKPSALASLAGRT